MSDLKQSIRVYMFELMEYAVLARAKHDLITYNQVTLVAMLFLTIYFKMPFPQRFDQLPAKEIWSMMDMVYEDLCNTDDLYLRDLYTPMLRLRFPPLSEVLKKEVA